MPASTSFRFSKLPRVSRCCLDGYLATLPLLLGLSIVFLSTLITLWQPVAACEDSACAAINTLINRDIAGILSRSREDPAAFPEVDIRREIRRFIVRTRGTIPPSCADSCFRSMQEDRKLDDAITTSSYNSRFEKAFVDTLYPDEYRKLYVSLTISPWAIDSRRRQEKCELLLTWGDSTFPLEPGRKWDGTPIVWPVRRQKGKLLEIESCTDMGIFRPHGVVALNVNTLPEYTEQSCFILGGFPWAEKTPAILCKDISGSVDSPKINFLKMACKTVWTNLADTTVDFAETACFPSFDDPQGHTKPNSKTTRFDRLFEKLGTLSVVKTVRSSSKRDSEAPEVIDVLIMTDGEHNECDLIHTCSISDSAKTEVVKSAVSLVEKWTRTELKAGREAIPFRLVLLKPPHEKPACAESTAMGRMWEDILGRVGGITLDIPGHLFKNPDVKALGEFLKQKLPPSTEAEWFVVNSCTLDDDGLAAKLTLRSMYGSLECTRKQGPRTRGLKIDGKVLERDVPLQLSEQEGMSTSVEFSLSDDPKFTWGDDPKGAVLETSITPGKHLGNGKIRFYRWPFDVPLPPSLSGTRSLGEYENLVLEKTNWKRVHPPSTLGVFLRRFLKRKDSEPGDTCQLRFGLLLGNLTCSADSLHRLYYQVNASAYGPPPEWERLDDGIRKTTLGRACIPVRVKGILVYKTAKHANEWHAMIFDRDCLTSGNLVLRLVLLVCSVALILIPTIVLVNAKNPERLKRSKFLRLVSSWAERLCLALGSVAPMIVMILFPAEDFPRWYAWIFISFLFVVCLPWLIRRRVHENRSRQAISLLPVLVLGIFGLFAFSVTTWQLVYRWVSSLTESISGGLVLMVLCGFIFSVLSEQLTRQDEYRSGWAD